MRDSINDTVASKVTIPNGMKSWNGGDKAPVDWDPNGGMLFRDGTFCPSDEGEPYWDHIWGDADIVAYTAREQYETWASIAKWCEDTFGPCGAHRMAERAMEEGAELLNETTGREDWTDKARIEVADMLICLSRVPGIWAAVEEKMAINRARTWDLRGDGTGYHVKPTSETDQLGGVGV